MASSLAFATGGVTVGVLFVFVAIRLTSAEAAPSSSPGTGTGSATTTTAASPNATPVLVELFTSEGCSSCPPADALVAKLSRSQPVQGARIVVLAHHVDYWNAIGWPDPFSSAASSSRQRSYAALGGGSYTPQAVVDGRAEMVGSRGSAIEDAIGAAAKRGHVKIDLEISPSPTNPKNTFDVAAKIGVMPEGTAADAELLVTVVQDRARVAVPRGENSGRTLDHVSIARGGVRTVGSINQNMRAAAGTTSMPTVIETPAPIAAPDGGSSFSVVAFVQERSSRRIIGTATAPLSPRP